jgi:hypothetical protein
VLAPGVGLREEDVAQVLAELKRGICDATGCTVAVVDHAPWPTESNRGQRRAFGSVFKTAAVRWSIHLEADAKDASKLWVEAAGNNVTGFRRTPAIFDPDTLEIRLLDVQRIDEQALDADVLAYIEEHPGKATTPIAEALGKSVNTIRESLHRLAAVASPDEKPEHSDNQHRWLGKVVYKTSADLGMAGTGHYWYPTNQAASQPSQLFQMAQDGSHPQPYPDAEPSQPSPTRRGDGSADGSLKTSVLNHPTETRDAPGLVPVEVDPALSPREGVEAT